MSVFISVIIPIYNTEIYLKRCIDSIVNQTYKNLQIILVDDGSTDNSFNISKSYTESDPRVEVYHKSNGGPSSARNLALSKIKGEYVYFLDSDDELELYAFESLVCVVEKLRPDVIFFDALCINEHDEQLLDDNYYNKYYRIGKYDTCCSGKEYFKKSMNNAEFIVCVPFNLIKKEVLVNLRYGDFIHEDELFSVQFLLKADKVIHLPKRLYKRRIRTGSIMTKNTSINNYLGYLNVLKDLCLIEPSFPELRIKCRGIYNLAVARYRQLDESQKKQIPNQWIELFDYAKNNNYFDSEKVKKQYESLFLNNSESELFDCIDMFAKKNVEDRKEKEIKHNQEIIDSIINNRFDVIYVKPERQKSLTNISCSSVFSNYLGEHCANSKIQEIDLSVFLFNMEIIKKHINNSTLLVIGEYEIFSEDGSLNDNLRNVLSEFTNELILYTSSFSKINFDSLEQQKKDELLKTFSNKDNLKLFVDAISSYNYFKNNFINCFLIPNISLAYSFTPYSYSEKFGILLVKQDNPGKSAFSIIEKELTECLGYNKESYSYSRIDIFPSSEKDSLNYLDRKLIEFSQSKLVITDSLDALLFCVITSTSCICLDNSDFTLSSFYNSWLKDCDFIRVFQVNDKKSIFERISSLQRDRKRIIQLSLDYNELTRILEEMTTNK